MGTMIAVSEAIATVAVAGASQIAIMVGKTRQTGHDMINPLAPTPSPAPAVPTGGGVRECGQAPACPHGVPPGRKRLTVKARSRKDAQRPLP